MAAAGEEGRGWICQKCGARAGTLLSYKRLLAKQCAGARAFDPGGPEAMAWAAQEQMDAWRA
eukprot:14661417-Alexandrium_andersonii.AAC.1